MVVLETNLAALVRAFLMDVSKFLTLVAAFRLVASTKGVAGVAG
jgi:hypothetical protein